MSRNCPVPADLVAHAFGDPVMPWIAAHAESCPSCRSEIRRLKATASALRSSVARLSAATACLDDEQIALLADGAVGGDTGGVSHLASCDRCRHRLAAVVRLVHDETVAAEILKLETRTPRLRGRRLSVLAALTAAGTAAAALVLAVRLPDETAPPPADSNPASGMHRESAITTTVAPHILGPPALATAADSLRWTSVPYADLYVVKLFDREGTVVWEAQTRDTALAMPEELTRKQAATYLWKVEARTGWDRWVASEWADVTIAPAP